MDVKAHMGFLGLSPRYRGRCSFSALLVPRLLDHKVQRADRYIVSIDIRPIVMLDAAARIDATVSRLRYSSGKTGRWRTTTGAALARASERKTTTPPATSYSPLYPAAYTNPGAL